MRKSFEVRRIGSEMRWAPTLKVCRRSTGLRACHGVYPVNHALTGVAIDYRPFGPRTQGQGRDAAASRGREGGLAPAFCRARQITYEPRAAKQVRSAVASCNFVDRISCASIYFAPSTNEYNEPRVRINKLLPAIAGVAQHSSSRSLVARISHCAPA